MSGLCMQFMDFPLVVEVSHSSWNQPEVFDRLREQGVGFCNIDQPVIGRSLAPSEHVTMPVGYVRLHGRNYEHWFTSNEHPEERYNYLYSIDELKPWAERIAHIAQSAEVVFVITNNHYQGKAIANALQLRAFCAAKRVPCRKLCARTTPNWRRLRCTARRPPSRNKAISPLGSPATGVVTR